MPSLSESIKSYAHDLGFSAVGIVPTSPGPHLDAYLRWLGRDMHGSMAFLALPYHIARRSDPSEIIPGAKSLIVAAFDYFSAPAPAEALDPARGRISNYAWGQDYHPIMTQKLKQLAEMVQSLVPAAASRVFVDKAPILERTHAERAGIGFVGKNTMIIDPRRGSYFFLGEIVSTLDLDYDEPARGKVPGCGTCTRCLTDCPTHAFPNPFVLDARLCISYLTIEYRGSVDKALRPLMGNWIYGCDICQEVCPWQRFAQPVARPEFEPLSVERAAPKLVSLLGLTVEDFEAQFAGSSIRRIGRDKLVSNACIAAGNSGHAELAEGLIPLLSHENASIRSHAAWALGQLCEGQAALSNAHAAELDPEVRKEFSEALAQFQA